MSGVFVSRTIAGAVAIALILATRVGASAQEPATKAALPSAGPAMSVGKSFTEVGGEALYAQVCAACHQADGEGAVGAASYPALTHNARLAAAGYSVTILVRGLRGMPPIGRMMTDTQVAEVVNYVRTHFDNHYDDAITPEDVKAARP
ncbi:cytochrome c [Methylobacterium sp. J-088]|uniref:c-type cytochrome n=1 Tax=Methylobacterium sp. J-088 TaxID=2836664 RepID=UPI001FBB0072|nr:cytochrome c [Methylobacterium sp. J-088]MCJ2065921.1 cytochrome c [Methylobacterium sp. J-088]